ncbi:hypothetical protein AB0N46_32405 [Streptomyces albidoflavus]|uniref:hypothetical protein n=1 Tax=Streptomyces albidoflavus TaxID=1886 RepID=UPI003431DE75
MGMSTNALLVYGYDLGGDDGGWELEGAGEYGELPPLDWYNPDDADADFWGAAENRLLATLAGFTEADWQADGYFARRRAALARLGVGFGTYCTDGCPSYLLHARILTAYSGEAEVVDMSALMAEVQAADASAQLRAALNALGLRPKQREPKWLLCSYRG